MSRHRAVRNMNIEEELNDDAFSEEEGFEMTPDEQVQFEDALDKVYEIVGDEATTGVPDSFVKQVVYDCFFDVNQSIDIILQEKARIDAARERRDDRGLPIRPPGEEGYEEYYAELGGQASDYLVPQSTGFTRRLSTISERTEGTERTPRTQNSGPWPSRQELLASRRPPSTPTTSSYGQVLHPSASTFGLRRKSGVEGGDARSDLTTSEDYGQVIDNERTIDPNDIHPSPSLSAIRHLEIRTPSPSPSGVSSVPTVQAPPQGKPYQTPGPRVRGHGTRSSSISSLSALRQAPPVATERSLPKIPSSKHSQSELGHSQASSKGGMSQMEASPKKSKLASLASSRKSKPPPSESSASYTTTETMATYPELRPRSLTTGYTSIPGSSLERQGDAASRGSASGSPGQKIDKARMSREAVTHSSFALPVQSRLSPTAHKTASLQSIPSEAPSTPTRPLLAVDPGKIEAPEHPEDEPHLTEIPTSVADKPPLSKLAQLAQAKAANREHTTRKIQKPRILNPPFAETQYLKPAYSNSSMTTAITTYTQTVDNMVAMSRADLPPSYPPDGKQSKLAQKAKNSNTKQKSSPAEDAQREALERARSHAQTLLHNGNLSAEPSQFASLLVNDRGLVKQPGPDGDGTYGQRAEQKAEKKTQERLLRRMRKEALLPMHLLNPTVLKSTAFTFDVPSPDDVVLNARKGTALDAARRSQPRSRQPSQPASEARSHAAVASAR